MACSAARGRGTCANRQGVRRAPLEKLILDGLRQRLLAPELIEEFFAAYHDEVNRARRHATAARAGKERELAEVKRRLEKLIEGYRASGLRQRLDELEARRAALEQELEADPPSPVRLHRNLAQVYRSRVERLQEALADPRDPRRGVRDPARADRACGCPPRRRSSSDRACRRDRADDRAGNGRQTGCAACGGGLFGEGGCGGRI